VGKCRVIAGHPACFMHFLYVNVKGHTLGCSDIPSKCISLINDQQYNAAGEEEEVLVGGKHRSRVTYFFVAGKSCSGSHFENPFSTKFLIHLARRVRNTAQAS
jgi:hypothetical protein